MKQHLHKQHFRQRAFLGVLACTFLGALLLSACSSGSSTGNSTRSSSSNNTSSSSAITQTQRDEGNVQLQSFQQWIALMQQYGGNAATYQQQYTSDQQALQSANTAAAYNQALSALQGHVNAIKTPALKQEIARLQQQLAQDVNTWGSQHTYHDAYDGKTYKLGYEYDNVTGIGGPVWLQDDLNTAKGLADYQQVVENLNMWNYLFQQMKANFTDNTPYNQVHQTDLKLIQHYDFASGPVVIVSLREQALRAYNNGKLVNAFRVTTGQPDLPSPPGTWWVEGKKHPTVFKSTAPKGSPDWYPDTPITYAMQYHSNGYFFHDAWWRTEFGPNTNFPHQDPNGDPFAGHGSHGCVNMSTANSAWLYGFVSLYTHILIY
ncbi:MAG TPA: L,D-transpeptidase family protein [Ktedonobacteraceae bacterium]